jgi:hypothetical protein
LEGLGVEAVDRLSGMGMIGELHKGEPARLPTFPLDRQHNGRDRADRREELFEFRPGGRIREIADKKPGGRDAAPCG